MEIKKFLRYASMILAMAVLSFTNVSCSDDDDAKEQTPASAKAYFYIEVTPDLLETCDIVVTYLDDNQLKKKMMYTTKFELVTTNTPLPADFGCSVVAKLKDNYEFKKNVYDMGAVEKSGKIYAILDKKGNKIESLSSSPIEFSGSFSSYDPEGVKKEFSDGSFVMDVAYSINTDGKIYHPWTLY